MAHQSFRGVRRFRLTPFLFPVAYRLRIFDHRGQPVYRLPVCARDQVPVVVHGDLDGMMPHLVLHVGKRFPVCDEPGREGMPQVVESDLTEACLFEDAPRPGMIRERRVRMSALSPGRAISRIAVSV